MKFGSLFAGIGGFDLGLERAGMTCEWQVEIDEYANRILAKHWPNVRRWSDVRTWPQPGASWVDVICGGFPCQDISIAGKGAGLDGERSGLWFEFARIIREMGPRIVVVENVAALLVPRRRGQPAAFSRVLGDLATLGYDAEWESLPAKAFGAPHERERVLLVAHARSNGGSEGWFSGPVFDQQHEIPRDIQWDSAKGVESGSGWKRWLVEAAGPLDRQDANGWFRRVDDGIPGDVDRFRGLGNALLPQAAEWLGRRIIDCTKGSRA